MSASVEVSPEPVAEPRGERVARNAGTYFVAQLLSWCVTFVTLSIVPRALGAQTLGETVIAGATVQTVFGVGMLSMECHVTREVGRSAHEAERLLRGLFGLRLALLPAFGLASLIALAAIHASERVRFFGLLALVGSTLLLFAEPLRYALAGMEQARKVSATDLLMTAAPLAMIPLLHYGVLAYYAVNTIAIGLALLLRAHWVNALVSLRPTFDLPVWRELIAGGLPFAVTSMIGALYGYVGIYVLHRFVDDAAVGQYSQAGRLIGTFLFVPNVLNTAMLPSLTRMAQGDPVLFRRAQLRVLSVLIVCAVPLTAGVILLGGRLCDVLYGPGQFAQLPLALKYSALTILPFYVVSTIYQFLVAQNRNAVWTYFMIGTLLLYTASAWLLVPLTAHVWHNGVVGAVVATIIAETVSAVAAFLFLRTNPLTREVMGRVVRSLIATAALAATVVIVKQFTMTTSPQWLLRFMGLVVPAAAGGAIYIVFAIALRVLPPEEQGLLLGAVRRKLARS